MHYKKNLICTRLSAFLIFCYLILVGNITIAQIKIEEIDIDKINKIIQNRDGKPLLINIWATWCMPCREEFPDLVKVSEKFKGKVDVIGISVDFPDEINSKILPFAEKNKVNFKLYVNSESDQEKFINYFDKEWNGAIPATFIYDANGKQVKRIYGKKDYNFFSSSLNQYLKR